MAFRRRMGGNEGNDDMNGKERILRHLDGKPVDALPLMPITMIFAADRIGGPALHCRRRVRDPARYAGRQRAGTGRIRPLTQTIDR